MIHVTLRFENALGYQFFIGIVIKMMNKVGIGMEIALVVVRIKEEHAIW